MWHVKTMWNSNFRVHKHVCIETQAHPFVYKFSITAFTWQHWEYLFQRPYKPQSLKYLVSCALQKKFANSYQQSQDRKYYIK